MRVSNHAILLKETLLKALHKSDSLTKKKFFISKARKRWDENRVRG